MGGLDRSVTDRAKCLVLSLDSLAEGQQLLMVVYHGGVYCQGLSLIDHLVRMARGSQRRAHQATPTCYVVVNEARVLRAHVVGFLRDPRHLGRRQLVIHDYAGFVRPYILTTCLTDRLTLP